MDITGFKSCLLKTKKTSATLSTTALEPANYKVFSAFNATEGLSLATSLCPDVVLLDLGLPDMGRPWKSSGKCRSWSQLYPSLCFLPEPARKKRSAPWIWVRTIILPNLSVRQNFLPEFGRPLRHSSRPRLQCAASSHLPCTKQMKIDFGPPPGDRQWKRGTPYPD